MNEWRTASPGRQKLDNWLQLIHAVVYPTINIYVVLCLNNLGRREGGKERRGEREGRREGGEEGRWRGGRREGRREEGGREGGNLLLTLKLPFSSLSRGFPLIRFSVLILSSSSFLSFSLLAASSALSRLIFCNSFRSSAVSSSSLKPTEILTVIILYTY